MIAHLRNGEAHFRLLKNPSSHAKSSHYAVLEEDYRQAAEYLERLARDLAAARVDADAAQILGHKQGKCEAVATLYHLHGGSTALADLYKQMGISSKLAYSVHFRWEAKQLENFEKEGWLKNG